jgi:hypothetical protein
LPRTWKSWAEEGSYWEDEETQVPFTAEDSVIGKHFSWSMMSGLLSFPGYYRSLNQGSMGLARRLGVEGIPGYYNWMDAILPEVVDVLGGPTSAYFILHPNLAMLLYEYGFKSKDEVYQYLYDTYFVTVEEYYNTGLFDFMTNSGVGVERTNPDGKTWIELIETEPDYKLHVFGSACIVVADGFADEHWYLNVFGGPPSPTHIDPWR